MALTFTPQREIISSRFVSASISERLELERASVGQNAEIRVASVIGARVSVESTGRKLKLFVVPYKHGYCDMGAYIERYAPGCFTGGLNQDPAVTWNHNCAYILGRVSAGTAVFTEDDNGVSVECNPPDTTWANDLLKSVARGDVPGASAGFFILKDQWIESPTRTRIILKARMREAAVCAFPAYTGTQSIVTDRSAANRSRNRLELDEARLRLLQML